MKTAAVVGGVLLSGLILLHRPDGLEVLVAARHIAALHPAGGGRLVPGGALCVVRLIDRGIFAVRESCDLIRQRMAEEVNK